MINIPHSNDGMWNPEYIAIKIIHSLQTTGRATIFINGDGGDAHEMGLYKLLDTICADLGYNEKQILILSNNQIEQHPRYFIKRDSPLVFDSGQEFILQNPIPEKNWDNIKHFGIFIGRSCWQRLWMASHIWSNHRNISEITYHYDANLDYHRVHLGLDELIHQIGVESVVQDVIPFMQHLPIKNDLIDQYPILTPAHYNISKIYPNFFVEIVCETFLKGNTFFPTEKTWRPLMCRTPFIVQGPRNFLANLRRLGFQTFDRWWDESYDMDADMDNGRVATRSIHQTLLRLSQMSKSDLESMYIDMLPTLEHNYQTFLSLSKQTFKKIWP